MLIEQIQLTLCLVSGGIVPPPPAITSAPDAGDEDGDGDEAAREQAEVAFERAENLGYDLEAVCPALAKRLGRIP